MRYSDDLITNEQHKAKDGERELVTWEMLEYYLGGDNTFGQAIEDLLDILNDQYPVEDARNTVIEAWEDQK